MYKIMLSSKVTYKYQATIPNEVRTFLHIQPGDRVTFKITKEEVTLKKISSANYQYLDSLSNSLCEWVSIEDEEAYDDL